MNVLADTWRGLVQRRLWPVALLLLAAAAAVPFLLAKDEEPLPNTPIAATEASGDDTAAAQPIVAVASSAQRELGRDVVGSSKDPFRPAIKAKKAKAPAKTSSSSTGGAATPSDSSGGGGTSVGPTPISPTTPTPGVPTEPRKRYEVATIAVRFGDSTATGTLYNLRRLTALPSVAEPLLIYLGLRKDGETAVFLVDAGVLAQGDGRCLPSSDNCQTIELEPGETEFLDVESESGSVSQYQLDYVKVRRKKASASQARRAYSATAAGGREVLRSRWGRMGHWRYDKKSGHIRQVGDVAYAADVQRYNERFGG
jgi:hypothetical protein